MNISTPNLHIFILPNHLGGNIVEVNLKAGLILDITFFDDDDNELIIADQKSMHLLNVNTLFYIKSKVYATN
jgi:hypothetical protein